MSNSNLMNFLLVAAAFASVALIVALAMLLAPRCLPGAMRGPSIGYAFLVYGCNSGGLPVQNRR